MTLHVNHALRDYKGPLNARILACLGFYRADNKASELSPTGMLCMDAGITSCRGQSSCQIQLHERDGIYGLPGGLA